MGLVDAQEARRILDRLYGYEVSPVLWRKVGPGLSAGRVQSPAIRLIVERELERMRFRSASYWDVDGDATPPRPAFPSTLTAVDGRRVASGKDFDEQGDARLRGARPRRGDRPGAGRGARGPALHRPLAGDEGPTAARPKPPFITSTLQQEGGRKLRLSARSR